MLICITYLLFNSMLKIDIFTNNKIYFVITKILHGASENHPAERSSCLVIEYTLHLLYVYVSNWFSGMDEVVRCSCGPALRLSHAAICLRVAVACSVQWRRLGVLCTDRSKLCDFLLSSTPLLDAYSSQKLYWNVPLSIKKSLMV